MKNYNMTTFEMMKLVIENKFVEGIEGYYNGGDPTPECYGKIENWQVEEIFLDNFDPIRASDNSWPSPSFVSINFNIDNEKIVAICDYEYYSFDNEYDEIADEITEFLKSNLPETDKFSEELDVDEELKFDYSFDFIDGNVVDFSVSIYDRKSDENRNIDDEDCIILSKRISELLNGMSILYEISNPKLSLSVSAGEIEDLKIKESRIDSYDSDEIEDSMEWSFSEDDLISPDAIIGFKIK